MVIHVVGRTNIRLKQVYMIKYPVELESNELINNHGKIKHGTAIAVHSYNKNCINIET